MRSRSSRMRWRSARRPASSVPGACPNARSSGERRLYGDARCGRIPISAPRASPFSGPRPRRPRRPPLASRLAIPYGDTMKIGWSVSHAHDHAPPLLDDLCGHLRWTPDSGAADSWIDGPDLYLLIRLCLLARDRRRDARHRGRGPVRRARRGVRATGRVRGGVARGRRSAARRYGHQPRVVGPPSAISAPPPPPCRWWPTRRAAASSSAGR